MNLLARLSDRVLVMSATPGKIINDMRIGLERPRQSEMATSPIFISAKQECLQSIRSESLRAFEEQNK
jgi:NitT/TauT family transport system ATP-binding protein